MKANRLVFAINCSLLALTLAAATALTGCPAASTTTPAAAQAPTLDPGYYTAQDETFGKVLAPIRAFITEEVVNQYPKLSPEQQAAIKPALDSAKLTANATLLLYLAYHNSLAPGAPLTATPPPEAAQVSDSILLLQTAQGKLQSVLTSAGVTPTPQ